MGHASELNSLTDAAEKAGAAGDWNAAEQLLRQAVDGQESAFGPMHPDLANTLNNLGVVCERTGKEAEAEQYYRRAYAIAKAVLPHDDPLVVTSGENLREFCEAQEGPVYLAPESLPTPPLAVQAQPETPVPAESQPPQKDRTVLPTSRPSAASVAVAAALALVAFIAIGGWPVSRETERDSATARPPFPPTPSVETTPPAPEPSPPQRTTETPAIVKAEPRPRPASLPGPVSVVTAQLCRNLSSDWRCAPVASPMNPGRLFFYTRLRSPVAANVEHRWYHEGTLRQTIRLRIGASQGRGYRTYSRTTVTAERAGAWSVELRSRDGTILHEERFQVLH